jgi:hexosaminidase
MKFILILLFAGMVSNAQIQKQLNHGLKIYLTEGTFALSKSFKINITGEPNGRILLVQLTFTSIDGRTGLF